MKKVQALPREKMIGELLKWFVLLAITFTTTFVHAKIWDDGGKVYAIHIGTFADVTMDDFKSLKKIGYVYAEPVAGKVNKIFLSKYKDKAIAEKNLKLVKSLGFPDAFIAEQNLALGTDTYVVQFTTLKSYEPLDWSKYQTMGAIAAVFDDTNIKIVAGPFDSIEGAKAEVKSIRANGYKDAFAKTVNSVMLHRINDFDTGGIGFVEEAILVEAETAEKEELVAKGTTVEVATKKLTLPKGIPVEYSAPVVKSIETPKSISKTKRTSMLELQKLMKAEKVYTSTLDGVYGKGTKKGLDKLKENKQLRKYEILASMAEKGAADKPQMNSVEEAIAIIPQNNFAAKEQLSSMKSPLAKAYLAYAHFIAKDDTTGKIINALMNDAIKSAYADYKGTAPFDYKATYAYVDSDQLLKHISYIHQVDKTVAAPCWLPTLDKEAYAKYFAGKIPSKNCGKVLDWSSLNTLTAISDDLSLTANDGFRLTTTALENAQPLSLGEKTKVKEWHNVLWLAMDDWAKQHAFHAKFVKPLKIAYHESWIQLEDYFISQGRSQSDANAMALQALQQVVAPRLEAYLK